MFFGHLVSCICACFLGEIVQFFGVTRCIGRTKSLFADLGLPDPTTTCISHRAGAELKPLHKVFITGSVECLDYRGVLALFKGMSLIEVPVE